jgi:hypothetical protein
MTTPQTLIKHLATSLPSSSSSSGKPIRALKAYIQSYIDLVLAPPSDRALLRVIKSTDTNIKLITDISGIESRKMLILKVVLLRQLSLIPCLPLFRRRRGGGGVGGPGRRGLRVMGRRPRGRVARSLWRTPGRRDLLRPRRRRVREERGRKRTNVGEEYLESRDMG